MTKHVARANAFETCAQSTPHSSYIAMLEISVEKDKYGTRTNKRDSCVLTTKVLAHALRHAACSIGKEPKART